MTAFLCIMIGLCMSLRVWFLFWDSVTVHIIVNLFFGLFYLWDGMKGKGWKGQDGVNLGFWPRKHTDGWRRERQGNSPSPGRGPECGRTGHGVSDTPNNSDMFIKTMLLYF